MQTLDELVFADEIDVDHIERLTKKLKFDFSQVASFQTNKSFQFRYIIESIRYGIVRVFTLGLTGFDTPGSVNGIEESRVAIMAMAKMLNVFHGQTNTQTEPIYTEITKLFDGANQYLHYNTDFENFDRLEFLKEYINPLYGLLYDFHSKLGVEFREEVDPTLSAHNYHTKTIFTDSFFNTSYYTEISESDLLDPKKIELGKILFFDPVLSNNMKMSCASCHNPKLAFTDGLLTSQSNTEGYYTSRNAPTLINATFSTRFFWDLREYDLERQVKHVMFDSLEFNMDFIELTDRLKSSEEYVFMFDEAYGDRDKYGISTWSISNQCPRGICKFIKKF